MHVELKRTTLPASSTPLLPYVQGMPTDFLLGDVFEIFLDEDAATQIKVCAPALRELFDGSEDKRRSQRVVLDGVVSLVTAPMGMAPKNGAAMLKKTPAILMALCILPPNSPLPLPHPYPSDPCIRYRSPSPNPQRPTRAACSVPTCMSHLCCVLGPGSYDIGLLEEAAVVEWCAQTVVQQDGAFKKVREAASPFIKWLQEATERSAEPAHVGGGSDEQQESVTEMDLFGSDLSDPDL